MGSEMLLRGGDIITLDGGNPRPEALAVRDGTIAASGDVSHCRSALDGPFEEIDLNGGALVPGFIDSHMHPTVLVFFELNVNLHGATSLAHLQHRLREEAGLKQPGEWVIGLNFDEQGFDVPRMPSGADLDEACPGRPVMVLKHDGHCVIAGATALEAAGINANTPDPEGGIIERDESGRPTGVLRESAVALLLAAMPFPDEPSLKRGAAAAFQRLSSLGVTTVGAILQSGAEGPAGGVGAFDIPLMGMFSEFIPQHIRAYVTVSDIAGLDALQGSALHMPSAVPFRKIGGIKLYADGTFSTSSAYMDEPFADSPGNRGFLLHGEDVLYRCMEDAHLRGYQVLIHSIGDASNRVCVELYRRLLTAHPKNDHRHRIEHASQLNPSIIADMAGLGIVASVQPMFMYSEKDWLHRRLGRQRLRYTYPFKSMMESGIIVAGASDAPIESPDVLRAISCCVNRDGFGPEERITAEQALKMYTTNAAFSLREETARGSLSPGRCADMVLLERDPMAAPADSIAGIKVLRTFIAGKTVYRA